MYIGRVRLCVFVSVCPSPHAYRTCPDIPLGEWYGVYPSWAVSGCNRRTGFVAMARIGRISLIHDLDLDLWSWPPNPCELCSSAKVQRQQRSVGSEDSSEPTDRCWRWTFADEQDRVETNGRTDGHTCRIDVVRAASYQQRQTIIALVCSRLYGSSKVCEWQRR